MVLGSMGEIIAERVLTLLQDNGNATQVFVRLGKPQASSEGDEYYCPFQVVGIGDEKVRQISGIDAFQALQLTLRVISFKLHHYRKQSKVVLYCWERGDDMGFPEDPQDKLSEPPMI
jgi:hypothetical protein